MAFGIKREELMEWKRRVESGEIAFLTHYWVDDRFPDARTVTKVGCKDLVKLIKWGQQYGLEKEWIHHRQGYPHFDLLGSRQKEILIAEGLQKHLW
ncbi:MULTISPECIES: hypothetical protein [unclassified Bacillus (in: firmicutes)]|uniref:hypothetical protein n=1 Tax=unclassified Bacillus (in: firmicutes) TaxID=185979 RepID=UPI0008ED2117|nr:MULTISPECIES: hypothetical protein [unclassified Bacillus (in: firmicutes)]SFA89094.1 hypothetical protein SAMN02799634_102368 [Bacillus sp. UNCCL13]SFQ84788.1 hypothetical protein SAMN04488577_2487 [Bacillus sp. cl95]